MPHINDIKDSKFLKQDDVDPAKLVTVTECFQENVAMQGQPQELKWCLAFEEFDKPLVLNSTNAQLIAKILGCEDTDGWIGHKIVLYKDPNISFGGKIVGGIRVRAPRGPQPSQMQGRAQAPAQPPPAATPPTARTGRAPRAALHNQPPPAAAPPPEPPYEPGADPTAPPGDDEVPF